MSKDKVSLLLKFVVPALGVALVAVDILTTAPAQRGPRDWIWAIVLFVTAGVLIGLGVAIVVQTNPDDRVVCAIEDVRADIRDEINIGTRVDDKKTILRPIAVRVSYSIRNATPVAIKASRANLTLLIGDVVEGWVLAPVQIHEEYMTYHRGGGVAEFDLEIPARSQINYAVHLGFTVQDDFLPQVLAGKLYGRVDFDVIGAGPQELTVQFRDVDTTLLTPSPSQPGSTPAALVP